MDCIGRSSMAPYIRTPSQPDKQVRATPPISSPLSLESPTGEPSRLIYFSFATLTSVSYGDAYPIHRIARSLAMMEALMDNSIPRS